MNGKVIQFVSNFSANGVAATFSVHIELGREEEI